MNGFTQILTKFKNGQITIYPPVVWPKFKLFIYDLKFDTLTTWGLIEI